MLEGIQLEANINSRLDEHPVKLELDHLHRLLSTALMRKKPLRRCRQPHLTRRSNPRAGGPRNCRAQGHRGGGSRWCRGARTAAVGRDSVGGRARQPRVARRRRGGTRVHAWRRRRVAAEPGAAQVEGRGGEGPREGGEQGCGGERERKKMRRWMRE